MRTPFRLARAVAAVLVISCGGKTVEQTLADGAGGSASPGDGGTRTGAGGAGGGRLDAGFGGGGVGVGGVMGGGAAAGGIPGTGGGPPIVDASPPPAWPDVVQNSACSIAPAAPAPVKWIDDFEGGTNYIPDLTWSEFDDGAEVITIGKGTPTPERIDQVAGSYDGKSQYGMHFQGYMALPGSTTTYGVTFSLETDFVWNAPGTRVSTDWSAYQGVVFWARVAAPSVVKGNVTFAIPTIDTDPGGGRCSDNAIDGGGVGSCYAHFSKDLRISRICWMPFITAFSDLRQTYGVPAPPGFDKAHVYGVELLVSAYKSDPTATYKVDLSKTNWPTDFFVDDMYLY